MHLHPWQLHRRVRLSRDCKEINPNNVGKAYQKCKGCGTIFIHQRMAAFPPNANLALAPPPAPSQQSAMPSAAPSATPSVPSAPQPEPLLPNGGCPKCGSLRGNKDCSVGYCEKCCVKNALGNPGRAPCNYRAHQLRRNGYAHQPAILPAPSLPIATLPSSSSLPIVSSPPIASAILAAPDLPPTRNLSNPLPSGWADARMRSLQIEQNTLNHTQQLQDSHIMLQQSYNLVCLIAAHRSFGIDNTA
ncbi:hypothetical protein JB92DRAFT_3141507 [Gautieria morchelliformis]|nr:hypothetical protein JB92DRAFT_3141507 [Gautieria morchelliformis]